MSFATEVGGWRALSLRMGGWQPTIYHQFDVARQLLIMGTSENSKPNYKSDSTEIRVTSPDAEEVYVFSLAGKHLRTLYGLTGAVKYLFTHDLNGDLIKVTDKYGQETIFTRDLVTRIVTSITSPKGLVTVLDYNTNGYLKSVSNPNQEIYSFEYKDATSGLLSRFTKPEGQYSTFTYDSAGFLVKDEHSGGFSQTLRSEYNPSNSHSPRSNFITTSEGRVTISSMQNSLTTSKETHYQQSTPDGVYISSRNGSTASSVKDNKKLQSISYSFDPRHVGATYTSLIGLTMNKKTNVTSYERKASLSNANDPFSIISLEYKERSVDGTKVSTYNPTNKEWSVVTSENRKSVSRMNAMEDIVQSQLGNLGPVKYSYLANGRLSKISQSERTTSFYYDQNGFLSKTIDPIGRITTQRNDLVGKPISITNPDGRTTHYEYDLNGNLISMKLPTNQNNDRVHSFEYNEQELLSKYSPPLLSGNSATDYEYNLDKELTKI
ncbi:MAG: hypothetical protein K2Q18_01500, partial [Bdellovibrionales bacterium]|nr:hypothetical protein [Bdellovibrionales bacterium]